MIVVSRKRPPRGALQLLVTKTWYRNVPFSKMLCLGGHHANASSKPASSPFFLKIWRSSFHSFVSFTSPDWFHGDSVLRSDRIFLFAHCLSLMLARFSLKIRPSPLFDRAFWSTLCRLPRASATRSSNRFVRNDNQAFRRSFIFRVDRLVYFFADRRFLSSSPHPQQSVPSLSWPYVLTVRLPFE